MEQFNVLFADPKGPSDFAWIAQLPSAQGLQLLAPVDASAQALAGLDRGAETLPLIEEFLAELPK